MKTLRLIIVIFCASLILGTGVKEILAENSSVSSTGNVTAQETVPVTSDYFGDQKFLQSVSEQVDTTKDGFLTIEERKAVKKLDLLSKKELNFAEIKGLEWFPELEELYISGKQTKNKMDLSKNTKLKKLVCFDYAHTDIDLSKNVALEEVIFRDSKLTTLNVNAALSLQMLDLTGSEDLKALQVSSCKQLTNLQCRNCGLEQLELKNFPKLRSLDVANNHLKKLNITKCDKLSWVDTFGNSGIKKWKWKGRRLSAKKNLRLSEGNIPNRILREKLAKKDKNKDGKLSPKEIKRIKSLVLDFEGQWVADFYGMESLTALKNLKIINANPQNQGILNELKVRELAIEGGNFRDVSIKDAKFLKSLDIRNSTSLTADEMSLQAVEIENVPQLRSITIKEGRCSVRKVLIRKAPKLTTATLFGIHLEKLVLRKVPKLEYLDVMANPDLAEVDLRKCQIQKGKRLVVACDVVRKVRKGKTAKVKVTDEMDPDASGDSYSEEELYVNPNKEIGGW